MEHNWTEFKKRISINADKEVLLEYWLTQDNLEKWFLSEANFYNNNEPKSRLSKITAGDKYKWMWHGSEDIGEGEVLENNNVDFLKFSFLGCLVGVKIKEEAGENIIELTQSEIGLDEDSRMSNYVGCSRGWTFYLANLKSILEGGIDLRNRNKKLSNVINT